MKRIIALAAGLLILAVAIYTNTQIKADPGAGPPSGASPNTQPQTRIRIINLYYILKNYEKWKAFQKELEEKTRQIMGDLSAKKTKAEMLQTKMRDPNLSQSERDAIEKELLALTRQFQDEELEAKKTMAKLQADQIKTIYHEVEAATIRTAQQYGVELVMLYNDKDPSDPGREDPGYIASSRMHMANCLPIWWTTNMDISHLVVYLLNSSYPAAGQTGGGRTK